MFSDESSDAEFWCPLGDEHAPRRFAVAPETTPEEAATLSRLAAGDWLSDVQIARLEALGFVERVFGQAVLTRLGRVALNIAD